MAKTKIEWTEYSWNVTTGCTPVSEGCRNCYAARFAKRLAGRFGYPADEPFRVTLHPERLNEPRKSELQKYKEAYEDDPLFKIKPLPLGKTNSSQIYESFKERRYWETSGHYRLCIKCMAEHLEIVAYFKETV